MLCVFVNHNSLHARSTAQHNAQREHRPFFLSLYYIVCWFAFLLLSMSPCLIITLFFASLFSFAFNIADDADNNDDDVADGR